MKYLIRTIMLALTALFVAAGSAAASTLEEIAALETGKTGRNAAEAVPVTDGSAAALAQKPRWHALSGGAHVDLNNWKVVMFMSSSCAYCHRYDPMVRQMADAAGIGVLAYSLDGQGDPAFPAPLTPTPEVMARFFGPGIPVATPTSFLVNVHTLTAFPLLQGNQAPLMDRLDEVWHVALSGGLR